MKVEVLKRECDVTLAYDGELVGTRVTGSLRVGLGKPRGVNHPRFTICKVCYRSTAICVEKGKFIYILYIGNVRKGRC